MKHEKKYSSQVRDVKSFLKVARKQAHHIYIDIIRETI